MVEFLDGPAAGQVLALRSAPEFLRVVRSSLRTGEDQWDALDQPGDTPKRGETLYAYRRVGKVQWMHLRCSPKSASGWYAMAKYQVIEPQPDAATMRFNGLWSLWVKANTEAPKDA